VVARGEEVELVAVVAVAGGERDEQSRCRPGEKQED
jgi:hypothetical protein